MADTDDEQPNTSAHTDGPDLRTWEDAEERTREFEALLKKYDGDFQKATDAQLRGERGDPRDAPGSRNPM